MENKHQRNWKYYPFPECLAAACGYVLLMGVAVYMTTGNTLPQKNPEYDTRKTHRIGLEVFNMADTNDNGAIDESERKVMANNLDHYHSYVQRQGKELSDVLISGLIDYTNKLAGIK